MKKYIFSLLVLTAMQLHAQQSPVKYNRQQAEKMLSPQQKAMLKQMGVAVPNQKMDAGQMQQDQQNYFEKIMGENVPQPDAKRLAAVNNKILSREELLVFISKVHDAIEKKLHGFDVGMMNKFSKNIQQKNPGTNALGAMASTAMILGEIDPALWLMGKACMENPDEPNTLNNYAAFLSMCGAQEYAIPILNRLNIEYPKNSTILNNLGQAWYGLGKLDRAKKYLDTAAIIFPGHSQATATKSKIAEKEGNTKEAVALEKQSIKTAYSEAKRKRIKKLGSDIGKGDISSHLRMPEDPVGFDRILDSRPEHYYYSEGDRDELGQKWGNYIAGCAELSERIKGQLLSLVKEGEARLGVPPAPNGSANTIVVPSFTCAKYAVLLKKLEEEYREFTVKVFKRSDEIQNLMQAQVNESIIKYGEAGTDGARCEALKEAQAKLFALQKQLEAHDNAVVKKAAHLLKELIYTAKYASTNELDYKMVQLGYEGEFLRFATGRETSTSPFDFQPSCANCSNFFEGVSVETCPVRPKKGKTVPVELPDFDIVNCKEKNTFGDERLIYFTLECNVMTTGINGEYLLLDGKYKENWVKDQMIEVTAGAKVKINGVTVSVEAGADDKGNTSGTIGIGGKVGGVGLGGTAGVNVDANGNVTGRGVVTATVGIVSVGGTVTVDRNGDVSSEGRVVINGGTVKVQGTVDDQGNPTGRIDIGKTIGIIENTTGPLHTNVETKVGMTIELDRNGISDVTTTVSGNAAGDLGGGDPNNTIGNRIGVNTGATGTYVWNAGGNTSLSAVLSGLNFGK